METYIRVHAAKKLPKATMLVEKFSNSLPTCAEVLTSSSLVSLDSKTNTYQDWLSGFKNPNWRDQIRRGLNATTEMDAYKWDSIVRPGYICWVHNTGTSCVDNTRKTNRRATFKGILVGSSWVPGYTESTYSEANNRSKTQLIQRIRERRADFEGLPFLGELAESLRMIRSPCKAFRKSLDDYRESTGKYFRRIKKRSELRQAISGLWLEYAFGWQPVVNDIFGLAEGFNEAFRLNEPFLIRIRSKGIYETVQFRKYNQTGQGVPPVKFGAYWDEHLKSTVKYYGLMEVTPNKFCNFNLDRLGLRLDSFVPALWEIMPYSWLIDYFTNIGEVISGWSMGKEGIKWLSRVHRFESSLVYGDKKWIPYDANVTNLSYTAMDWGQQDIVYKHVRREPVPASENLTPDFRWRIPGLGLRWLNLSVLTHGKLELSYRRFNSRK